MLFNWLDRLFGPHSVDLFANPDNAQLDQFNSRFWSLGSEAVDAFGQTRIIGGVPPFIWFLGLFVTLKLRNVREP